MFVYFALKCRNVYSTYEIIDILKENQVNHSNKTFMVENDNFFGSFDLGDGDVSCFLFDTESCLVLFVLVWTSLNLFGPVQF